MNRRVVFDTGVVVSALLFTGGHLTWLRKHWRDGACLPLISRAAAAELTRVFAYPKFRLSTAERDDLLAEYLPFCEVVEAAKVCRIKCRDPKDQPFLDLAHSGKADLLITGDRDILQLSGNAPFSIASPADYKALFSER